MTTTGRPRSGVPLDERSVVAHRRGVPWWAAVAIAVAATTLGVTVDLLRGDTLTAVFLVFYAAGCVAAVLAVAQRGLFAAMVQPPLVLAVAVPLVVKLLSGSTPGGLRNELIALALPLVNGFPTMAVTTVVTVALGTARIVVHRSATRAHTTRRTPTRTTDAPTRDPRAHPERRGRGDEPGAVTPPRPRPTRPR